MSNDPSQLDLAWRGYSGWAMLPSFVVCGLLSLVLLMSGWFIDEARGLTDRFGKLAIFALTWAIWIVQLFRWMYRGATYVYRLTPRSLFIDRGFLYDPEPAIDLAKVAKVEWGSDPFGRYFGVGWVTLFVENRASVTLPGILRPAAFAEEIQAAIKRINR